MIATTMPISTNTTIATCIQIHVGDMTVSVLRPYPATAVWAPMRD